MVDDGVEGQAVPEAVAEVLDVNVVVLRGHLATPDLERSKTLLLNRRHDAVVNQHLQQKTNRKVNISCPETCQRDEI